MDIRGVPESKECDIDDSEDADFYDNTVPLPNVCRSVFSEQRYTLLFFNIITCSRCLISLVKLTQSRKRIDKIGMLWFSKVFQAKHIRSLGSLHESRRASAPSCQEVMRGVHGMIGSGARGGATPCLQRRV